MSLLTTLAVNACLAWTAVADPPDHDAAMDAIIAATADARVIFLGEPDHGDGGSMTARWQLTERLYREGRLRWVVFESSAYHARQADLALDRGEPATTAVRAGLSDIWSSAVELEPLFSLFQSSRTSGTPLHLAGMDCIPVGEETRCAECAALLEASAVIADARVRSETRRTINRLQAWCAAFDPSTRAERPTELVAELDRMARALVSPAMTGDVTPNRNLARSLRSWAVWIRGVTPEFPMTKEAIDERDRMMAEHLLTLLDRIPADEQVVVWLHNVHAMRERPACTQGVDGEPVQGMCTPAATHVARTLGDSVYCLGLASASGHVAAAWSPTPRKIALPADAFERRALADHDADSVFIDFDDAHAHLRGPMPGGMVSFMDLAADWSRAFDGVWVRRKTTPVTRRRDAPDPQ